MNHWHIGSITKATGKTGFSYKLWRASRLSVRNFDNAPFQNGSRRDGTIRIERNGKDGSGSRKITLGVTCCLRFPMKFAVLKRYDSRGAWLEKMHCAFDNGIEHWLHVRRRTRDHLQDVCRRGLPLQRLLRLVYQPCVLDCDHGLLGEILKQCDLLVGEG